MSELIGVREEAGGRLQYRLSDEPDLSPGEIVVLENTGYPRLGTVVVAARQLVFLEARPTPVGVVRRARADERARLTPPRTTSGRRLLESLGLADPES